MSRQQFCRIVAAIGIFAVTSFAADSPFLGAWKINVAKSKFSAGAPSLKSATVNTVMEGRNFKSTVQAVDGNGAAINYTAIVPADGKPGTVTGSATVDGMTAKTVNDHTMTVTATKGGKTVYTDQRTVSKDGKTLTVKRSGTLPDGKNYEITIVAEKH
jgi:hypothetical protein